MVVNKRRGAPKIQTDGLDEPRLGYVTLWIDDAKVGCGRRGFFVYKIGHKWVSLFYPPLCCTVRVTAKAFQQMRAIPTEYQARPMIARIKANNASFHTDADGKVHTPGYVADVLRGIRSKRL